MRPCAALLAVVLALPAPVLGQQAATKDPPAATPSQADESAEAELARIKRGLASPTTIHDAALNAPTATFRTSVTGHVDIWKFWGDDPSSVAASVRPSGGTWHQEFQNMVTPDEFKGYGGVFTNAEKLQLAATSLAFAGAMQLIGAGVRQAKDALDDRAKRKAKEEVQSELEEFYRLHPEARPPATPLTPAVPVP
jgi:hypothetical protein